MLIYRKDAPEMRPGSLQFYNLRNSTRQNFSRKKTIKILSRAIEFRNFRWNCVANNKSDRPLSSKTDHFYLDPKQKLRVDATKLLNNEVLVYFMRRIKKLLGDNQSLSILETRTYDSSQRMGLSGMCKLWRNVFLANILTRSVKKFRPKNARNQRPGNWPSKIHGPWSSMWPYFVVKTGQPLPWINTLPAWRYEYI